MGPSAAGLLAKHRITKTSTNVPTTSVRKFHP